MTTGTPVICRMGGDEGADLVGRRGVVTSVDDLEMRWVNVSFEDELVDVVCYVSADWKAERDDWKDPGGWFITDCSPVVEAIHEMDAGLLAGLSITGIIAFASVLIGTALVLR
jgi:hypothetical protein